MNGSLISYIIKGIIIGGSMLIPGVSGGTMAITLGIYDELIEGVNTLMARKTTKLLMLMATAMGGILGILLLANPISKLIELFENPTMFFFIGAVVGGMPIMIKKSNQVEAGKKKVFGIDVIIYIVIGFALVYLLSMIPEGTFIFDENAGVLSWIILMIAGIVAAVALVLPGISVSYMFLVLGIYEDVLLKSIRSFDLGYLIPLGIGVLLGVALTTKSLETCMNKFPRATYNIIVGFIIASVIEAFPGLPENILEWIICPILFIVGFGIIYVLTLKEEKEA
jgi:Predicted membrane protein